MSERQRIPKLDIHSAGVFKRGLGWMVTDTGDDEIAILFQCPHNHRATIMNHSINAIGEVNASVLCYANCGYHEFVVLQDQFVCDIGVLIGCAVFCLPLGQHCSKYHC